MKRILFLFCIISPVLSFGQTANYNPKVSFAIETYAFLKGQNAALQKIATQFPQLKPNVTAAQKKIKNVFGRTEKNLKQFLKEELDYTQYNSLQNYLNSLLHHQFPNSIEKEKYAHDFLLKVQERSKNISNDTLSKGILSFKYHDTPHQEIIDGHIDFFTTENHPKAEEASLKIPIPKSWLAEEAEMPETIQQFTSYYGNGNEKILIVVYDLPAELQGITLTEKSIASILSPNTKLFRSEPVTIDGMPAIMIEVEESLEYNKNSSMKVRMLQFMLAQDNKLYCLQGSIGPEEAHEDLGLQIEKFEPLFRLIASRAELEE